MAEAKTETKPNEPMVKIEFLGEAYAGREIRRAVKGQSFVIAKTAAEKLVYSFPGEWKITDEKASVTPAEQSNVKKIIEPAKPATPAAPAAMTKATAFKPTKKVEVKPEMKKEPVKPVAPAAPAVPKPAAPQLKKEGNKMTRKRPGK